MTKLRHGTFGLVAALLVAGCGASEEGSEAAEGGEAEMASDEAPLPPDLGDPTPRVVLETTEGRIVLELNREVAPRTVDNFLLHVENDFYDGLTFHRVIPGFMIQAGGFTPEMRQRQSPRPPLRNEANNGLKNVRGSVAMARTSDPHSATSQFFINLVDNPNLDFTSETRQGWGYTVFGHVVDGMDVVDAIASTPTATRAGMQDVPQEPIVIERAYVEGT